MQNLPVWTVNMAELISRKLAKKEKVFRWHDSGDLQSVEHFSAIVDIANYLPEVRFWLPTREQKIIRSYKNVIPSNLVVRISMQMVGQEALPRKDFPQSTVGATKGFQCPARTQDNECKNCRACWNADVSSVNYSLH